MPKVPKSSSFVAEFPLRVNPAQVRILDNRFKAAANLYNGVLGQARKRATRMRRDPAWKQAAALRETTPEQKATRIAAFKALAEKHGFRQYDLQKYAEAMRDDSWIGHHLGSHDTQSTAKRAFTAVADWVYKRRGRPRFKPQRDMLSIEGKSNDAVIRFRDHTVLWAGLSLPIIRNKDKDHWQEQALACRTKYVRIKRTPGSKHPFSCQLVQEGQAPDRNLPRATEGVGGLDFGPSTVAVVVPNKVAALLPLGPKVQEKADTITLLQRAMDRSRRQTNPQNYNPDGTVKNGPKKWVRSRAYRQLADAKTRKERQLAAERKRAHGELSTQLLSLAPVWKTEKISYKSFQKNFGKSIGRRAPAMLVRELQRKAEACGGAVEEFPTRTTKLSQYDHTTDQFVKKPLSQRQHIFGDGKTQPVQRDLYSAFLAAFIQINLLDTRQVKTAWLGAEPLLRQPVFELPPIRKRGGRKTISHGVLRQSGSVVQAQHVAASAKGSQQSEPHPAPLGKSTTSTEMVPLPSKCGNKTSRNPLALAMGRFKVSWKTTRPTQKAAQIEHQLPTGQRNSLTFRPDYRTTTICRGGHERHTN